MSYPDSVRYLYALGNELKAGAKFGLERIGRLLAELGNPERCQRVIHVAGTNGKGSTSTFLASVLQEAGLRTGLFTSPHLVSPTERIQIAGTAVSEDEFADAFAIVHSAAERLIEERQIDAHPSYFETVTAMTFVLFRERVEISVIEVGLGGRLDATNVVHPELCVITPVSFDHEAFLGNTLESIAAEKAGILKPGVPVVLAEQEPPADQVIRARAFELHADIISAAIASATNAVFTARGSSFTIDGMGYECALAGRHQLQNAVTAIRAAQRLSIPDAAIAKGIKKTRWPGRLEYVSHSPDLVLDGAHNPAGAAALASYIEEFCANRPVWIVYGAMRDKAIDEVVGRLFPLADHLIATAPDFPRALRPEAILEMFSHPHASIARTVPEALALARAAPPDAVVFVTGSLFLVGEVRALVS